jgi:5,10-methylene-tetrahydrofolate dehydrogenase/methenyl tetrahydrofolate cyclohydrolase
MSTQSKRGSVESAEKDWLKERIIEKSLDKKIDGLLIQYPLPNTFPEGFEEIEGLIPEEKSMDAFLSTFSDWSTLTDTYLTSYLRPLPIPSLIAFEILRSLKDSTSFDRAVLLGSDPINSKPLAHFLKAYLPAGVAFEHRLDVPEEAKYKNEKCLVVSCLGKPRSVVLRNYGEGSVFLDFSFNTVKGRSEGDLNWDFRDLKLPVHATKVPGGTGLLIGAALLRNLYVAWKRSVTA